MALCLVPPGHAPSDPGTAIACRCCPAGSRSTLARRYPSDMTDAEWAVIEPLLPAPRWTTRQGGVRESLPNQADETLQVPRRSVGIHHQHNQQWAAAALPSSTSSWPRGS
jgi:hypothetical protein